MNEAILDRPTAVLQTKKSEDRPSNTEFLREYDINIKFLNRGCIVHVGCRTIAFESIENAMNAINAYVSNPYEEQEKWREVLR
jgi:hypothetical protein